MDIIRSVSDMKSRLLDERSRGKKVGFIPTMGYLHEGHASLIHRARQETDFIVVSIFVNPTQFGPHEDLKLYPRDLERDSSVCEKNNVDVIFFPSTDEMYPNGEIKITMAYPELFSKLCGKFRPGHFEGVTTVMSKLLSIFGECNCYMGRKDAQQLQIIKRLASDLFFQNEIIGCSTYREASGLAMSSRNTYLSSEEKEKAIVLSQSLFSFVKELNSETLNINTLIDDSINTINSNGLDVQYFSFVDRNTFQDIAVLEPGEYLIAVAALIGKARLIDNFFVDINEDGSIDIDTGICIPTSENENTYV